MQPGFNRCNYGLKPHQLQGYRVCSSTAQRRVKQFCNDQGCSDQSNEDKFVELLKVNYGHEQDPDPVPSTPEEVAEMRRTTGTALAPPKPTNTALLPAVQLLPQEEAQERCVDLIRSVRKNIKRGNPLDTLSDISALMQAGVMPNVHVITTLIQSFNSAGQVRMGEMVFKEMFNITDDEMLLQPDGKVVAALIDGYGKCMPPQWSKIVRLELLARNRYKVNDMIEIYNSMLSICSNTNDVTRGRMLIYRMVQLGIPGNAQTYRACERKRLLRKMCKKYIGKLRDLDPEEYYRRVERNREFMEPPPPSPLDVY